MVIKIKINSEAKENAGFHALNRKRAENKHNYKSYFYERNTIDTYRKAYLGEWAFEEFLKAINKNAEIDKPYNRPDKYDFKVSNQTVDVKTSKFKTDIDTFLDNPRIWALVVDFQVQNKPQDIYVFACLNEEETHIWLVGWATLEEVKSWEIRSIRAVNRVCSFRKLRPIEELKL